MRKLFIIFFLVSAFLAGCGSGGKKAAVMEPETIEMQPRSGTAPADEAGFTQIFLAGTIDMGNSVDWQAAMVERLRDMDGRYIVWNPRRGGVVDFTPAEMEYQIKWELDNLERSDIIIMNILGTSKSPITLLEMGIHMRSGKLYVACEPDYYRYDNVRVTCGYYGVPLFGSLEELLASLEASGKL